MFKASNVTKTEILFCIVNFHTDLFTVMDAISRSASICYPCLSKYNQDDIDYSIFMPNSVCEI